MSNKTPTTIADAITKFLTTKYTTKIAVKRNYDNWQLKQIYTDWRRKVLVHGQKLDLNAHTEHGSDLAVAKFVLSLYRGQVRDERGIWLSRRKDLPPDYTNSFKLTAIKASGLGLLTEGIDNFVGLEYVQSIDLSNNPKLDDFACDQLSRQFRRSKYLREINLSHNPLISLHGLDILFRIPSIKKIIAIGTQAGEHEEADAFVLAAEDERNCEVFVYDENRRFRLPELDDLTIKNQKLID